MADTRNKILEDIRDVINGGGDVINDGGGQLQRMTTAERNSLTGITIGYSIFNLDTEEQQTLVTGGWYCHKKSAMGCGTTNEITVVNTPLTPSFITGLSGSFFGFELYDSAKGTFKNVTGRSVQAMTGTISFHPNETGPGAALIQLISERCPAGLDPDNDANWEVNPSSLRTIEVPSDAESFATKVSFIANVGDQSYFRFRFYEDGPGGVVFGSTTDTILGQSVTSVSAIFEITEQYTIDPIV